MPATSTPFYKGGEEVAIHLNSVPDAREIKVRSRWTDSYVKWSPMGSYLATFHPRGIAVWGGQDFNQIAKFEHPGVQFIDFSPCENYMVTFSPPNNRHAETATGPDGEPTAITIWETRTGVKKRSFHADMPHVWPIFKWSHNDKFFARMSKDGALQIYETPSFGLLDKKSVKAIGKVWHSCDWGLRIDDWFVFELSRCAYKIHWRTHGLIPGMESESRGEM